MARTLYFTDNTQVALFCDDTEKLVDDLERILRECLGNDTADLLCDIMQEYRDMVAILKDELKAIYVSNSKQ